MKKDTRVIISWILEVLLLAAFSIFSLCCATAKSKKKDDASKGTGEKSAVATPAPQWVDSPVSVYPVSAYFQSVGTGVDRASAELEAVRGIASIFSQNVESTSHASKRMEQAIKDGKSAVTTVAGISQDTVTKVNLDDLIGVEIKGYWQNVKENNYLAIAVLDKGKATQIYTSMIQQNDKEERALIDADASNTAEYFTFETYARFDLAREMAQKNESLLERLQVINPSAASELRSTILSSKQIMGKALEIAKAIPIGIIVEGDKDNRIKAAFASSVSGAGFRTSDIARERYMITAAVSLERHDTRDGATVQCRYNVDAPLRDSVSDEVLLPYSASGREASKDWQTAQYNAYKAIEKKIKSTFGKAFTDYAASVAAY